MLIDVFLMYEKAKYKSKIKGIAAKYKTISNAREVSTKRYLNLFFFQLKDLNFKDMSGTSAIRR